MTIGKRIRLSRNASGLSLRGLQAKINNEVSAQAISKYERDEIIPSSVVLMALAKALEVPLDYFFGTEEISLEFIEFRRGQRLRKRKWDQIKSKANVMLEHCLAVEKTLGCSVPSWNAPRSVPWPVVSDYSEIEGAAHSLRQYWRLGLGPIPNLVETVEQNGIKMLHMDLGDTAGLTATARINGHRAATLVVSNSRDCGERQRFTIAHELGHLILDVATDLDKEKAANRFAGAFLVPAETLRYEMGKRRTAIGWGELFDLKRVFGVSVQTLTYRCCELGIFSRLLGRSLFSEYDRLGWHSSPYREPLQLAAEKSGRFRRLCFRALAEGAISESKAAELLGLPAFDLARIMDEPSQLETG